MDLVLKEICGLAQSMTHAPRVSISFRDFKNRYVDVFARTSGPARQVDIKYAMPLIGIKMPILLVRDIKKVPELRNHPITELMPNLTSFASYLICGDERGDTVFTIWNPSSEFFDNEFSNATMEKLVEIIRTILVPPTLAKPHISNEQISLAEAPKLIEEYRAIPNEPASQFLIDTLVEKQRLLGRNGCSYLGLRTWRKSIKPYQISALTAVKKNTSPEMVETIATEFFRAIQQTYGATFQHVVPVPCGSSGNKNCLSVQLARVLAKKLDIQFSNVLQSSAPPGKSHPKNSSRLEPFEVSTPIAGNVLIVDDVVTSGKHIELATKALRMHSSFCTAVAWIAD